MEQQDGVISGRVSSKNVVKQRRDELQQYFLFVASLNKLCRLQCVKTRECGQMSEGNTADKWARTVCAQCELMERYLLCFRRHRGALRDSISYKCERKHREKIILEGFFYYK